MPDSAFEPGEGDDRAHARALKVHNARERSGQGQLVSTGDLTSTSGHGAAVLLSVQRADLTATGVADVEAAEQHYREFRADEDTIRSQRVADAWCAAFVNPKVPGQPQITTDTLRALAEGRAGPSTSQVLTEHAARHRFLHWHLEFPEVYTVTDPLGDAPTGWRGGFRVVLGNPPWIAHAGRAAQPLP